MYTTTAPTLTASRVARALACALVMLTAYAVQECAHLIRTAARLARTAWHWLNARHDFGNEEGQILWTGWQALGASACALAFALFLSIDWDALV